VFLKDYVRVLVAMFFLVYVNGYVIFHNK
jgi:hypothetical protein